MGGKHKRLIRSEKAKVKLKGIKLAKGLNITKTDFKVKKILIKEQLREDTSTSGKHVLCIKELINKLSHHNSSFVIDALKLIKERITSDPRNVIQNLGSLIHALAPVCLSETAEVRQEALKVVNVLLESVHHENLIPFYDALSSYLRYGMTHINTRIQDDSLLLLDIYLSTIPKLVILHVQRILPFLLEIIFKLRTNVKLGSKVITNIRHKETSVQWRQKGLQILNNVLKLFTEDSVIKRKKTTVTRDFSFRSNKSNFISIVPMLTNVYSYSIENNASKLEDKNYGTTIVSEVLYRHAKDIISILIQSWLEARPVSSDRKNELNYDACVSLTASLDIFLNLIELSFFCDEDQKNNEMSQQILLWFKEDFRRYIWDGFPYSYKNTTKDSKLISKKHLSKRNSSEKVNSKFCARQNLACVKVLCLLHTNVDCVFEKRILTMIFNFLKKLLNNSQYLKEFDMMLFVDVVKYIIYINGQKIIKIDGKQAKDFLSDLVNAQISNKFSRKIQYEINSIFCHIVENSTLCEQYGMTQFDAWLHNAAYEVCSSELPTENILLYTNLAKRKNIRFLDSIKKMAPQLFDNIVSLNKNETELKTKVKLIINLFYWVDWSTEEKNSILQYITNLYPCTAKEYITLILHKAFGK